MTVRFILGVVVPYVSWAVFVLGLAWRTGSWLRRPVPVSITLLARSFEPRWPGGSHGRPNCWVSAACGAAIAGCGWRPG